MLPNTVKRPIGILGGTFDPIHLGHLRLALEIQRNCLLDEIRFMPCKIPVLKPNAHASAEQRIMLLRLAIVNEPQFLIDTREISRATPSYMVDTLQSLREDFPNTPLCLILGTDTLHQLHHWHQFEKLFDLSHLIIAHRAGTSLPDKKHPIMPFIQPRLIASVDSLHTALAGHCWIQAITPLSISSSDIRTQCNLHQSPRYLLPDAVWQYIQLNQIYST